LFSEISRQDTLHKQTNEGLIGGNKSRGTQLAKLLKYYVAIFDELAPHLYYHTKHSAKEGPVYRFVESTKRQDK
jgi:hypothetical protein